MEIVNPNGPLLSLSLSLSLIEAFSLHGTASGPDLWFRRYWPFSHRKIPKIPASIVTTGADQIYLRFLGRFLFRTSQGGEFSLLYASNRNKNSLW